MSTNGIKKLYYSISEVSEMLGVEAHVLRYWETEFRELAPKKNRAGRRIYRKRDIETVRRIKHLLKEKKYTIDGARQVLSGAVEEDEDNSVISKKELGEIRGFLQKLLDSLE